MKYTLCWKVQSSVALYTAAGIDMKIKAVNKSINAPIASEIANPQRHLAGLRRRLIHLFVMLPI